MRKQVWVLSITAPTGVQQVDERMFYGHVTIGGKTQEKKGHDTEAAALKDAIEAYSLEDATGPAADSGAEWAIRNRDENRAVVAAAKARLAELELPTQEEK